MSTDRKRAARTRRHARLRRRLRGTPGRPRLAVYRSNRAIYAQVIDDRRGHTLVAASSLEPQPDTGGGPKVSQAAGVGAKLAQRARAAGIRQVVFDRGGNAYHGRVRALAEAAREGGLDF